MGSLGAAGLVFTVLFAYLAWQAAKRSADAATAANWSFIKASRLDLRAYVSAENIRVEQLLSGRRPRFALDIVNRGATPARDLEVWSDAVECVGNPNAKRVRKLAKPTGSKFAIAPHQDISQSGDMLVAIEGSDLAALHAGRWTLVFFGIIRYRDVYGVRHWTMFKTYVSSGALKDGAARLGACRRNNYST